MNIVGFGECLERIYKFGWSLTSGVFESFLEYLLVLEYNFWGCEGA